MVRLLFVVSVFSFVSGFPLPCADSSHAEPWQVSTPLTLHTIRPSSGLQGSTAAVTLYGQGFDQGSAELQVTGTGVIVNGVQVVNTNVIRALLVLTGESGMRAVSAVVAGRTSSTVSFEVLASPLVNAAAGVTSSHLNVDTFVGSAGGSGTRDGRGTEARFMTPSAITGDSRYIYVADTDANTIRKISRTTSNVTTIAGGPAQFTNGIFPVALWTDGVYLYMVSDDFDLTIQRLSLATGEITTLAGRNSGSAVVDGIGTQARFGEPYAITGDGQFLYVLDHGTPPIYGPSPERVLIAPGLPPSVRQVSISTGEVRTIPLPAVRGGAAPSAIRAQDGFVYLAYDQGAGGLYLGRMNVATQESETLFESFPGMPTAGRPSSLLPLPFWADGRESFYFVSNNSIHRLSLVTREVKTVALPFAANVNKLAGLWGDGDELYVSDSAASIVFKVVLPTTQVTLVAGLPPTNLDPRILQLQMTLGGNWGVWGDGKSVYIANGATHTIRKLAIDTGVTSIFAGTGEPGADDGPADKAHFSNPFGVWGDASNLYVSDSENRTIRRLAFATGEVSTLAGSPGSRGSSDGVGAEARFMEPRYMWGDATYLYVSDGQAIRRVDKATATVTTLTAIPGETRADGTAALPVPASPTGLWGDGTNLFVATGSTIVTIDLATREITLLAGNPGLGLIDGVGARAYFSFPRGIWGDGGGNLYVADEHYVRKVVIATGAVDTVAASARFDFLYGIWGHGDALYVTDGSKVRKMKLSSNEVTTLAELPLLYSAGVFPTEKFASAAVWGDGEFLYAPAGHAIYRLSLATGQVTHVAGVFHASGNADGIVTARFYSPSGIWGDGRYLYVADTGNSAIRRIDLLTKDVTYFAGGNKSGIDPRVLGSADGIGSAARFVFPAGIWGDGKYLYVADRKGYAIRRITIATREVKTLAGTLPQSNDPAALWGDGTALYFIEDYTCAIRKIVLATGQLTTFVNRVGVCGHDVEPESKRYDQTPSGSGIFRPPGIWGDGRQLFVSTLSTIVAVDLTTGRSRTVPGSDSRRGLENGPATDARFVSPSGLWSDGSTLYVADGPIRKVSLAPLSTISNEGSVGFSITNQGGVSLVASRPDSLTVGYALMQPASRNAAPDGVAIFSSVQNGVLISEAAVPAVPLSLSGRIYADASTGVAIANPNARSTTISFYFTDANGENFSQGVTTIAANSQIAAFLNEEPFYSAESSRRPLADARTFTFMSSLPVGTIALRGFVNERSEFLMTTLPVVPLRSTGTRPILIPHIATLGGWNTRLLLVNPTDSFITGSLEVMNPLGAVTSSVAYRIPPRSSIRQEIPDSRPTGRGSIRIVPDQANPAPFASTVFSFTQGGVTVTESGVAQTGTSQAFRVFVETTGKFGDPGSIRTGLALTMGPAPGSIFIELRDLRGNLITAVGPSLLPGYGQSSFFIHEIPGFENLPVPFAGVLRISTDSPSGLSVIGVRGRYNERGDFLIATMPAISEEAIPFDEEMIFPHIVRGGGYTTQFIMMSRSATAGEIRTFTQSGQSWPIAIVPSPY